MTFSAPAMIRFTGRSTVAFRRRESTAAQIRLRKNVFPNVTSAAIRTFALLMLMAAESPR